MPASPPLVCLVPADPDAAEPLRVLAAHLAEGRSPPTTRLMRPDDLILPDRWPPAALIVLAGQPLPGDLIEAAQARRIGLIWAEAGPTPRLDRRGFWPGRLKRCLAALAEIHARDSAAALALVRQVPASVPVLATGTLARHAPAGGCNLSDLDDLRAALDGRPAWFGYSLPAAEFDAVLAAHGAALRLNHRLVLIAAPRDPREGADLAARAGALGFEAARRADAPTLAPTTQVLVADAEDEPGLFLRLAPVTYLGGSLTAGAGTPPAMPAAALGTALIFGREGDRGGTDRNLDRSLPDQLHATGGGRRITRPAELGSALTALLAPEVGAAAALQAWTLATQGSEATLALARAVGDWLAVNAKSPAGEGA